MRRPWEALPVLLRRPVPGQWHRLREEHGGSRRAQEENLEGPKDMESVPSLVWRATPEKSCTCTLAQSHRSSFSRTHFHILLGGYREFLMPSRASLGPRNLEGVDSGPRCAGLLIALLPPSQAAVQWRNHASCSLSQAPSPLWKPLFPSGLPECSPASWSLTPTSARGEMALRELLCLGLDVCS